MLKEEHFTFDIQYKHSEWRTVLLQKSENVRPDSGNSIAENATPLSNSFPGYEVAPL